MANNLLNEPFGIDEALQRIQIDLYQEMGLILEGEIEGYGRVYKNPINTGSKGSEAYSTSKIITPEWFNAEKQDYESVFFDDNKACVFCFLPNETDESEDEYVFSNNVNVVFMADLDKIYPNIPQRLDAKLEVEAVQVLRGISYSQFEVIGIERRIESVFKEFSINEIKFDNMDKSHVFAIKIKLTYDINNKC